MSSSRYDPQSPQFRNLSSRGPPGAPNYHYASPQGKAIRKQQNFDHAMKDRRIQQEQKQKINSIISKRGDPATKPTQPTKCRNRPKIPSKPQPPKAKPKYLSESKFGGSRAFKKIAPTKAIPSKV